jgi:RNA recognition motif-containing protein
MESPEEADSAISALNSQEIGGRQLRVNEANDRPKRNRNNW